MVEIVGDPIEPSELIVPRYLDNSQTMSGALFISGSILFFVDANGTLVDTTT